MIEPRACGQLRLDLNGASAAWKAVVLLPFLDAAALRAAFKRVAEQLSSDERARNRFGPTYLYVPPSDARLAEEVWALAAAHKEKDGYQMAKVVVPISADDGLAALLTPYPSVPRGARREPPSARLPPVAANRVASAVIRLPQAKPHMSVLLLGAGESGRLSLGLNAESVWLGRRSRALHLRARQGRRRDPAAHRRLLLAGGPARRRRLRAADGLAAGLRRRRP